MWGMCTRACQRCMAQPKDIPMLVRCHRHASVPDACSIRGLIGKPDLIGMVMHMGRRRDVGSMGANGWVCMSCPLSPAQG